MQRHLKITGLFAVNLLIVISLLFLSYARASSQTTTPTLTATAAAEATAATETASTAEVTATASGTTAATLTITQPTVQATAAQAVTATATPTAAIIPETGPQPQQVSQSPRTVTVAGTGVVEGQPDMAVIVVGVRTEDDTAAGALSQNNTQMQSLLTALRNAGVANTDIRTLNVQLQPRYQRPTTTAPDAPLTVNGFIASNMVEVTVRDLDSMGGLLDAAVQAGGNRLEGIRFDFSDPSALLDEARAAAMRDARHKAEQLVQLAGARLGVVMTINESSNRPLPVMRDLAQASQQIDVPISAGTQPIQVDIQVTWEIQ